MLLHPLQRQEKARELYDLLHALESEQRLGNVSMLYLPYDQARYPHDVKQILAAWIHQLAPRMGQRENLVMRLSLNIADRNLFSFRSPALPPFRPKTIGDDHFRWMVYGIARRHAWDYYRSCINPDAKGGSLDIELIHKRYAGEDEYQQVCNEALEMSWIWF